MYRYSKDAYVYPLGEELLVVDGNTFRQAQQGDESDEELYQPQVWEDQVGASGVTIESQDAFWNRRTAAYDD